MEKQQIKEIILSQDTRGDVEKMLIERFFNENDVLCIEDFKDAYDKWFDTYMGGLALFQVFDDVLGPEDARLERGVTAIERGSYRILENKHILWTDVVRDPETHLLGLVTTDKNEILPCLFTNVYVTLDWFIEVTFREQKYSFAFNSKDHYAHLKQWFEEKDNFRMKGCFQYWYDGYKTYEITNDFDYCGDANCVEQKLYELLNVNHRLSFES